MLSEALPEQCPPIPVRGLISGSSATKDSIGTLVNLGSSVFSKVWNRHLLAETPEGLSLLYVDRHFVHEVTSPVAFASLRASGRGVRRPDLTFAVMDHNVPTRERTLDVADPLSEKQMQALVSNASDFGIECFGLESPCRGISHVIGPELGLTLPGSTLVCGDSHTATHGALGALALGIGTSECEHVLATQTLWLRKPKEMRIKINGTLARGVTMKDVALWTIRKMGAGGAIGHAIEYSGETISNASLEERMTIANMSVEGGARTAIMQPDEETYDYLKDGPYAPKGEQWESALGYWQDLTSDPDAEYDRSLEFDVGGLEPQVTWGTNPAMTAGVTERVPTAEAYPEKERAAFERAMDYMGLRPGMAITDIGVDVVFIGSCTNGRLSDLVEAARVAKGGSVSSKVRAMVVPGSQAVKRRAENLGIDEVFRNAGFEWRDSGCSMCLAMNEDRLEPGERCASTSNRNFENRQGQGGRTHLVSPPMAAAAALEGRFVDVRDFALADLSGFTERETPHG